jgi:hypothetical protein
MIVFSAVPVGAFCECGYVSTITTGAATDNYIFTDILESDLFHVKNVEMDTDWSIQNYNVSASAARGPYG